MLYVDNMLIIFPLGWQKPNLVSSQTKYKNTITPSSDKLTTLISRSISRPLTHWGLDKMNLILQATYQSSLSRMEIVVYWSDYWYEFFPWVPITRNPSLVQIIAWRLTVSFCRCFSQWAIKSGHLFVTEYSVFLDLRKALHEENVTLARIYTYVLLFFLRDNSLCYFISI